MALISKLFQDFGGKRPGELDTSGKRQPVDPLDDRLGGIERAFHAGQRCSRRAVVDEELAVGEELDRAPASTIRRRARRSRRRSPPSAASAGRGASTGQDMGHSREVISRRVAVLADVVDDMKERASSKPTRSTSSNRTGPSAASPPPPCPRPGGCPSARAFLPDGGEVRFPEPMGPARMTTGDGQSASVFDDRYRRAQRVGIKQVLPPGRRVVVELPGAAVRRRRFVMLYSGQDGTISWADCPLRWRACGRRAICPCPW